MFEAATSGNPKFFLGTDSAPHPTYDKLTYVFNTILMHIFEFKEKIAPVQVVISQKSILYFLLSRFYCCCFLRSIHSSCGCAGVYSAHCAVEIYAEVFELAGHLNRLEDFCSSFGADHYGLPRNTDTMTLEKKSWKVPKTYKFGNDTVTPLKAGEEVTWTIL